MLRKNRLKCESISARLFLACHQKFNAFKCKQFCCAKPTLAHLLAGGFVPRPRERRAAVHKLLFSVGSSAHSPANALELGRVRARAACVASRPLASSVSLFHCGAAIGSLIKKSAWSLAFTLQEFKKRGLSACLNLSIGYADNGQPRGLSLQTVGNGQIILCRSCGNGAARSPHPTRQ